ncbi:hypothetical protein Y032_0009g615 [Ancylostoma ceylanicum]|uniref:Uncharacterized protein n=1 Tax=Ancylostoma ceylanicum TaxID=53326 RepID=A0A016VI10_9BILA|nr:hypothetical protein Y032_0009g615 [Ancylostoma ceylanicum]
MVGGARLSYYVHCTHGSTVQSSLGTHHRTSLPLLATPSNSFRIQIYAYLSGGDHHAIYGIHFNFSTVIITVVIVALCVA